ncbi:MAG: hypothetical protein HY461_01305 [Parcubacteria group bacterium]|nr:hypothetical protein [Parcubacteria group bacterium]
MAVLLLPGCGAAPVAVDRTPRPTGMRIERMEIKDKGQAYQVLVRLNLRPCEAQELTFWEPAAGPFTSSAQTIPFAVFIHMDGESGYVAELPKARLQHPEQGVLLRIRMRVQADLLIRYVYVTPEGAVIHLRTSYALAWPRGITFEDYDALYTEQAAQVTREVAEILAELGFPGALQEPK